MKEKLKIKIEHDIKVNERCLEEEIDGYIKKNIKTMDKIR